MKLGMPTRYARIMGAFGFLAFVFLDTSLTKDYVNRTLSLWLGTISLIAAFVVVIAGSVVERREGSKQQEDK